MEIHDTEKHERVVGVFLNRSQLEGIIERAIAEKTGIPIETLRKHGKLKIEENTEGSPSYGAGHKASFRATIPLGELPAPEHA